MKKMSTTCITVSSEPMNRKLGKIKYVNRVASINNQLSLMVQTFRAIELVETDTFMICDIDHSPLDYLENLSRGMAYGDYFINTSAKSSLVKSGTWDADRYLNGQLNISTPVIKTSHGLSVIKNLPLIEHDFIFSLQYFVAEVFGSFYQTDLFSERNSFKEDPITAQTALSLRSMTKDWILQNQQTVKNNILHT